MKRFRIVVLFLALAAVLAHAQDKPWRSALYPADWTPAFRDAQGRGLPDFSYAGYHNGEAPLPSAIPGPVFDAVKQFHADATGASDSTAAIQAAIDAAAKAKGGTVLLPAGLYRCDGLLQVTQSGVVIRGAGPMQTKLEFTRAKDLSDTTNLNFRGAVKEGKDLPLARDGEKGSFDVFLADSGALAPGDDVAVGWTITDAFVADHGMTGVWKSFNGKWRPFFRRTVRAIDRRASPARVTLDVPLRYPARTRDGASVRVETGYLKEVGVEGIAVTNAVAPDGAWASVRAHVIGFDGVKDAWMRDVKSFASPLPEAQGAHLQNCGVIVAASKRVTIADSTLAKAQNRGPSGCGYLFEITRSSEILIRDCDGVEGRHNFIQNWDFGTSGCVFLRVRSRGGVSLISKAVPLGMPGLCEYHHSLAMANLVDGATLDDGWYAGNRGAESSGAGWSATDDAFWNCRGRGMLASWQYGVGFVIGTQGLNVMTGMSGPYAAGSEPEDFTEGIGAGAGLEPASLYEDQLARRMGKKGK